MSTIESEPLTLSEIKKYDTEGLISFLQGHKNLELSGTAIKILEKKELNGGTFFDMTEEKYMQDGTCYETREVRQGVQEEKEACVFLIPQFERNTALTVMA